MASERAVIYVKKVTYFGGLCYPNNLVLKKGIAVMRMSFTRGEFTLSKQNLVTYISAGFWPPC